MIEETNTPPAPGTETIREAAARILKESRAAQGFPPVIEDRRVILRAMRSVPPVRIYTKEPEE